MSGDGQPAGSAEVSESNNPQRQHSTNCSPRTELRCSSIGVIAEDSLAQSKSQRIWFGPRQSFISAHRGRREKTQQT